jgi:hypothetical protein
MKGSPKKSMLFINTFYDFFQKVLIFILEFILVRILCYSHNLFLN